MKTILIGSVTTSEKLLKTMIEMNFPISYVFSLGEEYSTNVSGYYPIHKIAEENNVPYKVFKKINDEENIKIIKEIEPDYIFVVGISQLVSKEIIDCAKIGTIGFHPAPLPKFRGRASNVWQQLLGIRQTKCSMFFIDEGVDSGDILGQEEYLIGENDYAYDVMNNIENAVIDLSKKVLKQIMDGTLKPIKQDDSQATYTLKRSIEDGLIDWNKSLKDIHLLVRAVSRPYPGAFGMYDGIHKIIIWKAEMLENNKYIGFNGQIAKITSEYIDVVCKDGLLRITEFENIDNIKMFVGHKLK